MRIKFWGVRGSIPSPGVDTVRYGGNTACLELYIEELDRLIIIDAGSGIRQLGNHLLDTHSDGTPIKAEIFLTHTHWDHIMGFPFFTPIYMPTSQFTIYGPVTYDEEPLKEVLSGQWTYRYFPVRHDDLSSEVSYVNLKEGEYDLGEGLKLKTKFLNHPLLCLGYRFEFMGRIFCTAYDTEPFRNLFCCDPTDPNYDAETASQGEEAAQEANGQIGQFVQGADLLIYDTMYTKEEYERSRIGWGHSYMEHAIDIAERNQVKRLSLFHHDIQRTDDQLDALAEKYCRPPGGDTEIFFAREGMVIDL